MGGIDRHSSPGSRDGIASTLVFFCLFFDIVVGGKTMEHGYQIVVSPVGSYEVFVSTIGCL
jgi:hypothetical protein